MPEEIQDVVVLFCAPLSRYPTQPSDVSKCHLIDCTNCHKPMWISAKKEGIKIIAEEANREIILLCYVCFEEWSINNPEWIKDHTYIKI